MQRYGVQIYHGESGSIAYVVANADPDISPISYSTKRFGADFRALAQDKADELSRLDNIRS